MPHSHQNNDKADPGYQFAQTEGLNQLNRLASAQGLLESGKNLKGLQEYSQGLADQNYQRQVGQTLGLYSDWQNRLQGQAGQGAQLATNAAQQGSGLSGLLAQLSGQQASNLGSLFANQGAAGAGLFANTAAASANTLMNAAALQAQADAASQAQGAAALGGLGQLGGAILGGFF